MYSLTRENRDFGSAFSLGDISVHRIGRRAAVILKMMNTYQPHQIVNLCIIVLQSPHSLKLINLFCVYLGSPIVTFWIAIRFSI
jgi:hypothetical protein